jgi:hypothetical protein
VAPRDLADSPPEEAALRDDHLVARLEQVRDARLHAGGAGAVQGEHQAAGRAVHAPEHLHDVQQDLVERRVEMAEHRPAHRVEHVRVDVRGAGAAEQALGRREMGEVHHVTVPQRRDEHKLRVFRDT